MIRNIERTWFEVWGEATAQNRLLKGLTAFLLVLMAVQSIALVVITFRKPVLIAVSAIESKVLAPQPPNQELLEQEVRRVIASYLRTRHNWEGDQIENQLNQAIRLVDSDFEKEFRKATSEQAKIAKDKKIGQRFYPSELALNLKTNTIRVTGDRILIVDGLRAASALTLEIGFRLGLRTASNPEGVFVTSEKLISTQNK